MAKPHPYDWLIEPIEDDPTFVRRAMFGCLGCYLRGKLVCVLAAGDEPWNGLFIPLERDQHASVLAEFPALNPHCVLGKWLYLPAARDDFEPVGETLIERIRENDPRFGVIPPPRKKRAKKKARRSPID